jgi:signal transduction histidine kinase
LSHSPLLFFLFPPPQLQFQTKKEFVRFLTHEYRLSLNPIIKGIDTIRENLKVSQYMYHLFPVVRDIRSACNMAVALLDNVFFVNDLEDNTLVLDRMESKVDELVSEAIEPMRKKVLSLESVCLSLPSVPLDLASSHTRFTPHSSPSLSLCHARHWRKAFN